MIDLHHIAPQHAAIDERLKNWARWSRDRGGGYVHPMFRGYRPDNFEREPPGQGVDQLDATAMQKVVVQLPEKHRLALAWCYIHPYISPGKTARLLAVSMRGLADMLFEARCMVINRERN